MFQTRGKTMLNVPMATLFTKVQSFVAALPMFAKHWQ